MYITAVFQILTDNSMDVKCQDREESLYLGLFNVVTKENLGRKLAAFPYYLGL